MSGQATAPQRKPRPDEPTYFGHDLQQVTIDMRAGVYSLLIRSTCEIQTSLGAVQAQPGDVLVMAGERLYVFPPDQVKVHK